MNYGKHAHMNNSNTCLKSSYKETIWHNLFLCINYFSFGITQRITGKLHTWRTSIQVRRVVVKITSGITCLAVSINLALKLSKQI